MGSRSTARSPTLLRLCGRCPWLVAEACRAGGRIWAGGDDLTLPHLSPLYGTMEGLPPTLLLSGTRNTLHPGVVELVRRLKRAEVALETGNGLIHVYPLLPIPEARGPIEMMAAFIGRVTA